MTDDRDELLREIGGALSIEPTPELAARVRAQVAGLGMGWTWRRHALTAVTMAVVAGAVAIALPVTKHAALPAAVSVTSADRPEPAPEPLPARLPVPSQHQRSVARGRHALVAAGSVASTEARPLQEVLVPTDQAEGLRLWMASVGTGQAVLPPSRRVVDEVTGELLPLPEIVRIEVPALAVVPLPNGNGSSETRGLDD